jgi:hypothetical protein
MANQTTLCQFIRYFQSEEIKPKSYYRANSLVDGYLEKYRNAFSLIVPGIKQLGYYARISEDMTPKKLSALSISPEGNILLFFLNIGLNPP